MIPRFMLDEQGCFVRDVFYRLKLDDPTLEDFEWRNLQESQSTHGSDGVIVMAPIGLSGSGKAVYAMEYGIEWKWVSKCNQSQEHPSVMVTDKAVVELRGDVLNPLVHCFDEGILLVKREVANILRESKLVGAEFGPVHIRMNTTNVHVKDDDLRFLQFRRRSYFRPSRIHPPEANRCFHCGFAPLICPDCGARLGFMDCPRCKTELFETKVDQKENDDARIRIEPYPSDEPIIEVSEWRGEDFMGKTSYPVVTRRVLDFFQARHIGPFEAYPLRANIEGVSKEKLTLLERAKKPI